MWVNEESLTSESCLIHSFPAESGAVQSDEVRAAQSDGVRAFGVRRKHITAIISAVDDVIQDGRLLDA